jgi:hypothetical protein
MRYTPFLIFQLFIAVPTSGTAAQLDCRFLKDSAVVSSGCKVDTTNISKCTYNFSATVIANCVTEPALKEFHCGIVSGTSLGNGMTHDQGATFGASLKEGTGPLYSAFCGD